MNYMKLDYPDVVNGKGTRLTLFVTGCEHECKGCYNQSTWNPNSGLPFTKDVEDFIIDTFNNSPIPYKGLSLSGGDPLYPKNLETIINLCRRVKTETTNKNIWLWTGYTFEYLSDKQKEVLQYLDVLIDGKYIESLRNKKLVFRGSSNQRIIDVPQTLESNKIVERKYDPVDAILNGRRS